MTATCKHSNTFIVELCLNNGVVGTLRMLWHQVSKFMKESSLDKLFSDVRIEPGSVLAKVGAWFGFEPCQKEWIPLFKGKEKKGRQMDSVPF